MDETTKIRMRGWLMGQICTSAESPNAIPFLVFGTFGLWLPSVWRVIDEGRIVASSITDNDRLSEVLPPLLIGQKVRSIDAHGPFHDLELRFESGMQLESFSYLERYENWTLVGGADKMVIAGPGDSWSAF